MSTAYKQNVSEKSDKKFDISHFLCYNLDNYEHWRHEMAVSYKKLWKLLIDKDLKKKDLETLAGVSHYTINKLNRGENVTTDILGKICKALNCTVDDIMEFVEVDDND